MTEEISHETEKQPKVVSHSDNHGTLEKIKHSKAKKKFFNFLLYIILIKVSVPITKKILNNNITIDSLFVHFGL